MKPEAWIIVRLLIHASKTPSTFYASPEIARAILYLTKEYGLESLHAAIDSIKEELK